MTLELFPRDAPEVVAIRPERIEMARPGRVEIEPPELVPAILRCAHGMVDCREEADDDRRQRRADEAEHDSSRPDSRRVRDAKPPVDQRVHEAGERADACEHERDRAGVAHGACECLSVGPVRLRQRLRPEGSKHRNYGCGHE